jgi:hypothetical protein
VLETGKDQFGKDLAEQPKLCAVWVHRTVRCAGLALVKWLLSGLRRRCTAINHRTVRWCTGLSGEPFTGEVVALGKRSTAYGYKSPDCPVSQRSAGPTVGRAICARHVAEPTVRRGHRTASVHRTVSSEPTAPNRQQSAAPKQERNMHRTVRCARRQKAKIAFLECSQRLLAALGL